MKNRWYLLFLLLPAGCATAPKDTLMQVSTIDALLAGVYDGQMTCGELLKQGNFGIGTFDGLEGEMIVLEKKVYQARADGTVRQPPNDATTPFAVIVRFDADQTATIDDAGEMNCSRLQAFVDDMEPNQNLFVAIRYDGIFPAMKVRSVPKQQKPYPRLADVTPYQSVFEYTNVTGTVLGFRCPAFVKGVNVPGHHLHFISADRKTGGHILDFTAAGGALNLDTFHRFLMVLPEDERLRIMDFSQDRSMELERVEK